MPGPALRARRNERRALIPLKARRHRRTPGDAGEHGTDDRRERVQRKLRKLGSGSSGQSTRRLSLARPVSAGLSHSKQPDDLFWRVGEHYPHYQEPDARCLQLDAADDGGLKLLL